MALQRVKVVNPGDDWISTKCYINGKKIEHVTAVDFQVSVDELPTFTFETMGLPEIDMTGDIWFSFTPQTVMMAVKVLRNELLKHGELYNAFLASIRSAIMDMPSDKEIWTDDLAEMVLKRLIGEECT